MMREWVGLIPEIRTIWMIGREAEQDADIIESEVLRMRSFLR